MKLREPLLRIFWVVALFLIQLRFLGTWELNSDDANTIFAARRFFHELYWFGPLTSLGVRHPPFVYFLWSVFLRFGGTLKALQVGILLSGAAAHWMLIGVGRRFGGLRLGYLASAVAFLNVSSFVFYSQKFWEPAALPLFTLAALSALLAWEEKGKAAFLAISFAAILCATGGHLNAVLFFPAGAAAAWLWRKEWKIPPWCLVACVFFGAMSLLPVFAWNAISQLWKPALGGLAVLPVVYFLSLEPSRFARALLAVFAIGLFYFLIASPAADPVRRLEELFLPVAFAIPERVGAAGNQPWWSHLFGGVLALFFLARTGWRFSAESRPRQLLYLWLLVPCLGLFAEALVLKHFHSHWEVFLFPAAWLAVADSVFWLGERLRGASLVLAAVLLFLHGAEAWRLEKFVAESGGVAWHMSSLATKEAVMDRIALEGGMPEIYEVLIPYGKPWYVEFEAWRLLREMHLDTDWRGRTGAGKQFYVHQENGLSSEPNLLPMLRAEKGVTEERVGSVTIFTSDHFLEGAGVAVK